MSRFCAEINSILKNLQAGKIEYLKKLFDATYFHLKQVALRYAVDKNDYQDILQETYLKVLRYINTFDTTQDGYNWLCKIVQNVAYEFNRKVDPSDFDERKINQSVLYGTQNEDIITRSALRDAISKLPEEDRQLLYLRFWEDMSYSEIAIATQATKSTVCKKLKILLKKLKNI